MGQEGWSIGGAEPGLAKAGADSLQQANFNQRPEPYAFLPDLSAVFSHIRLGALPFDKVMP
jgi:hypothetical protein